MARSASISLGGHFAEFIDRQMDGGWHNSASDVVRAGLRLLEEREARLEALRSALAEGEAGGDFQDFDHESFLPSMRLNSGP